VPVTAELRKQFTKAFESLAHHRQRHEVFADFLELAVCAVRKTTLPPGAEADALEERYMATVRRNTPEDVRAMPELLGITALAVQQGGCDFLGQVAGDLELVGGQMGQFFTPYEICRLLAEMTLQDAGEIMKGRGFVTLCEPASGAGGMVIAAADVIEKQGFDIGRQLYADATDLSEFCFRMTYLQLSLRGIPATVRRGNSLSLETFDHAVTPAFLPFLLANGPAFAAWREEARTAAVQPEPPRPPMQPSRRPAGDAAQLSLFDPG
jgi:type I restriction-modification system DNA methylase subunit